MIKDKMSTKTPNKDSDSESGERLQKVLARLGLASRREIEEWIKSGRVTLNGQYAKLGDRYGRGIALRPMAARLIRALKRRNPPACWSTTSPPAKL